MQVSVKHGGLETFRQALDDSKTLNATVAFLMQQTQGTAVLVTVNNNGHDLPFNLNTIDMNGLVRVINGIPSKAKKA